MANWVSAGCGVIANELAQAMEKRGQKLYGVVNRTQEKAVAFAEKRSVRIRRWISSISLRLIIRIFNFCEKLWQQVSMCCARNPLR